MILYEAQRFTNGLLSIMDSRAVDDEYLTEGQPGRCDLWAGFLVEDHSLRRQPTASRHSSSTLDHESELRSGVLVGWSTVGLRPTTNQDRLVRSKIWSKVVDEWGRGEVLQLWWNRFSHEIKSHIFSELNLLIFDLRSPVAVWVYWRPHINRWPKVKISSEKIPWEGEFTFRSDPWAGLIASWGSFYPMTHHNGLPP